MYTLTSALPPSGGFLMIWTYANEVWTDKYHYFGDILHKYNSSADSWESVRVSDIEEMHTTEGVTKIKYVVSGEL